mmetsp:Transcript_24671/g.32126  ORF Transcript_24671/g.32126 Transcript_24671/m.32126 type:complete len:589 (+) Transcript_24671:186-1952(+)
MHLISKKQKYELIPGDEGTEIDPSIQPNLGSHKLLRSVAIIFLVLAPSVLLIVELLKKEESEVSAVPIITITNDYSDLMSLSNYPWDHIVEPYKETTLNSGREDNGCHWIISTNQKVVSEYDGCNDIIHVFDGVSNEYLIELTYDGGILKTTAMCKYVRREIRSLTKGDQIRYFSALEVIHTLELAEGQAVYGDKFANYEYFTAKHLDVMRPNDCFPFVGPFHGSNSFLTSHAAFTLDLELALQSVDPTLTQPYWDFTIDAELGSAWVESELFGYDFFGPLSQRTLSSAKWFSDLPAPFNTLGDETSPTKHNSYGKLTNDVNRDSSKFVTRGGPEVCGADVSGTMPTAADMAACDQWSSLTSWRSCIETMVHAYIHVQVGGAWDCGGGDLSELADPQRSLIALNAINIWKIAAESEMLVCPLTCDESSDCSCSCDATKASGALTAILEFLYLTVTAWDLYGEVAPILTKNANGAVSFVGLSDVENDAILDTLLALSCAPGEMGAMTTDAAANDPFFWPLHLLYDRAWMLKRLENALEYDWVDNPSECFGGNPSDVMPFLFDGFQSDMTNEELYTYFEPTTLPYVYDAF